EILAGDTGYENEHSLLKRTFGRVYYIEDFTATPWSPATSEGDKYRVSLVLREQYQLGAICPEIA
ncbi:MAG: hypothetical protein ACYSWU_24105, partial [Planctomycetota bacterium]